MAKNVFYVPIFFIVFREMIEAAIIISVLLSFVEQLMSTGRLSHAETVDEAVNPADDGAHNARVHRILKRMRIQIWAGTLTGFFISLAIGAAFIAVFYTTLDKSDLWSKTEQIWEGVFSLIAAILIFIMGIAFLKMDRSRIKWRYKLAAAFDRDSNKMLEGAEGNTKPSWTTKWALFILPFITLIREGLEAVVFVGGVSLNTQASAIPLPVVIGIIAGLAVGYVIYKTGSSSTLHWFLVISTTFLFLIGAGLFAKAIGFFEYYHFAKAVGGDVAETGDGPGSWYVANAVWHLTYGNPEPSSPTTNGGWQIFNAIFGWNNNASYGTILGYCFYWVAVMLALLYHKWNEGRFTFFGLLPSSAHKRRMERREERANGVPSHGFNNKVDSDSASDSVPANGEKASPVVV